MDKQRLIDMFSMHLDGYTMQEIAEKYNISKQRVSQLLRVKEPKQRYLNRFDKFPRLIEWMNQNKITIKRLQEITGLSTSTTSTVKKRLEGSTEFKCCEIKKILGYSGRTFEDLFAEANESEKQ